MGKIRLTATFLDEVSTDIPHQNWGAKEWDADFAAMKHIGIETVVMIRCGLEHFITYPPQILMERIQGNVDIFAFQDGNCTLDELPRTLEINRHLADKYRIALWANTESSDRDMPFKFSPIKWEKLLLKLKIAEIAGIDKAMTFEFLHFMSPNFFWSSAGHLYNRYCEYLKQRE